MSDAQNILVARNNTFVAESDLEAATRAIDLSFEKEMSKRQDLTDEASRRIHLALLTACRDSLLSHIERVVEPVSDEAFYQFTNNQDAEESMKSLSRRKDTCQSEPESKVDLDDFDVEDLVDQQASLRARELRKNARDEAQHLRDLRIRVIDRATSLAKRQVEVLTKPEQNNIIPLTGNEDDSNTLLQQVSDEAGAKLSDIRDHVNMLCASLQKQGRESRIAASVSSLDETVSNVRNALENPQDTSKTSQAIHERNMNGSGSNDGVEKMEMPDRFIQFLGQ